MKIKEELIFFFFFIIGHTIITVYTLQLVNKIHRDHHQHLSISHSTFQKPGREGSAYPVTATWILSFSEATRADAFKGHVRSVPRAECFLSARNSKLSCRTVFGTYFTWFFKMNDMIQSNNTFHDTSYKIKVFL